MSDQDIFVSEPITVSKTERNAAIIVACRTKSVREVAAEFSLKENSVYNILAKCGVSVRALKRQNPSLAKRRKAAKKSNVETPTVSHAVTSGAVQTDSLLDVIVVLRDHSVNAAADILSSNPALVELAANHLRSIGFSVFGG